MPGSQLWPGSSFCLSSQGTRDQDLRLPMLPLLRSVGNGSRAAPVGSSSHWGRRRSILAKCWFRFRDAEPSGLRRICFPVKPGGKQK